MTPKQLGALLLLAAVWGASFLFYRVAVPVLGPFVLVELRVLLAGLALLAYALIVRKKLELRANLGKLFILGLLNSVIPFTLIAAAQLTLSASLASILNATTPLFAAIAASIWLSEKLSVKRLMGLPIGVLGVAALVGWSPLEFNAQVALAVGMMLLAALAYALAGIYIKHQLTGVSGLTLAAGQQLSAAAMLIVPATLNVPTTPPSLTVALAVLALALVSTALAYLLYFYLMAEVGPTKTLSVTYLIPLFGSLWGVLFLQESFTPGMLVGLALVMLSVTLVNEVSLPFLRRFRGKFNS